MVAFRSRKKSSRPGLVAESFLKNSCIGQQRRNLWEEGLLILCKCRRSLDCSEFGAGLVSAMWRRPVWLKWGRREAQSTRRVCARGLVGNVISIICGPSGEFWEDFRRGRHSYIYILEIPLWKKKKKYHCGSEVGDGWKRGKKGQGNHSQTRGRKLSRD